MIRDFGTGESTINDQIKNTKLDFQKQEKFLKRKIDNAENQKKKKSEKKCKVENKNESARASTSEEKAIQEDLGLKNNKMGCLRLFAISLFLVVQLTIVDKLMRLGAAGN